MYNIVSSPGGSRGMPSYRALEDVVRILPSIKSPLMLAQFVAYFNTTTHNFVVSLRRLSCPPIARGNRPFTT